MTTTDIKTQIHQTIDNIPEKHLNNVLLLLTKIQCECEEDIGYTTFDSYVDAIIQENKELLEKLSQ